VSKGAGIQRLRFIAVFEAVPVVVGSLQDLDERPHEPTGRAEFSMHTPDKFPDLMAAAIKKQGIALLAVNENLVTTRGQGA
jgi:hypothetical protein